MSRKIPNKTAKSREKPMTGAFCVTQSFEESNAKRNLTLYKLVYQTRFSMVAVFVLLMSFLVQGVPEARAAELETEPVSNVLETPTDIAPDTIVLDEAADIYAEVEDDESDLSEVFADKSPLPDEEESVDREEEVFDTDDEQVETDDEFIEDDSELDEETQGSDSEEDLFDDVFIDEEIASSSDLVAVAYSDDSFSFNKAECTELASGSFYCKKPQENELQDALFSARDSDGDLEVYLMRESIETQVTHNETDDTAPFFDQNSNSIVWHRLVDDRYQIISYDVETGTEEQLTFTPENNMEPNRQGKYTVWQRWVNGGWNIVLHDGRNETEITKTTSHNVAPYIHGNLVVWNRHDQVNDRTIEMYDLSTETYVTIEDPEGMSVANPRMVFVYDSLAANGDIVTKGYDMLAKKFIDLDTLPRSLPEDLPASEGTGETRALIQNKPNGKSELEELANIRSENGTSTPNPVVPTPIIDDNASSSLYTLDLTEQTEPVLEPEVTPPADLIIIDSSLDLPEPEEVVEFVLPS